MSNSRYTSTFTTVLSLGSAVGSNLLLLYYVARVYMSVSIDKRTVHRVVVHCMQSYSTYVLSDAPLLELSSYPFSMNTNFVADVNLASSLLHKLRRGIRKKEA